MQYITIAALKKRGACSREIRRFNRIFGVRAKISETNLELAYRYNFDLDWLELLLSPSSRRRYYAYIFDRSIDHDSRRKKLMQMLLHAKAWARPRRYV